MTDVLFILVLSVIVCYVDWRIIKSLPAAGGNGVGSVLEVLSGRARIPVRYRVFVPWLCWLFTPSSKIKTDKIPVTWAAYDPTYRWIKRAGVVFAFAASWWFWGVVGVNQAFASCLLALYFTWAAMFDYADTYWEIGFLALGLGLLGVPNSIFWLSFVVAVAALNRETAAIIPAVAIATGLWSAGLFLTLVFVMAYRIPRLIYGHGMRYCQFNMIGVNWQRFRDDYRRYLHFGAFAAVVVCLYAVSWPPSPTQVVFGLFFLSMLIPSVWYEIRVFAPLVLALIPMALGVL